VPAPAVASLLCVLAVTGPQPLPMLCWRASRARQTFLAVGGSRGRQPTNREVSGRARGVVADNETGTKLRTQGRGLIALGPLAPKLFQRSKASCA
jgi:hypothetical protein